MLLTQALAEAARAHQEDRDAAAARYAIAKSQLVGLESEIARGQAVEEQLKVFLLRAPCETRRLRLGQLEQNARLAAEEAAREIAAALQRVEQLQAETGTQAAGLAEVDLH